MFKKVFSLAILSLLLCACLNNGKLDIKPQISTSYFVRNQTDTLYVKVKDGAFMLDTISVGDTISFAVVYDAVSSYNMLLSARITWDKEYMDLKTGDISKILPSLSSESNIEGGVFKMMNGYRGVSIPFRYIALKSGVPELKFTAESDSQFSPTEVIVKAPIRDKK